MSKKLKLVGVISLLMVLVGCNGLTNNLVDDLLDSAAINEFMAKEIAESFGNLENGLNQEFSSNTNLAISNDGKGIKPYPRGATSIIYNNGGLVDFTYYNQTPPGDEANYGDHYYEKKRTDQLVINHNNYSGSLTGLTARFWFYNQDEGVGIFAPVTPNEGETVSVNPKNITAIKSLRYKRIVEAEMTNSRRGVTRTITATTNMLVSGIHDSVAGLIITGTREEVVSFANNKWEGNLTINYTYTDFNVTAATNANEVTFAYEGTVYVTVTGTITHRSSGKSKNINKAADLIFSGTSTVTVNVEGETTTVNLNTGETD